MCTLPVEIRSVDGLKDSQLMCQKIRQSFSELFLVNGSSRPLLSFIFGLFKQTLQFLQQYM